MPNTDLRGPLVAALVYDHLCLFEFAIAVEIFGLPRPEFAQEWYRFASCAVAPGSFDAQGGLVVETTFDLSLLEGADIIIVPGWTGVDVPVPDMLSAALIAAYDRGAQLVSICSGAFVLAATGLLNGRRAATHWRYAQQLQLKHPSICVDADVLYIDEGRILTSAGSAAGIDLMLHIVRRDYGSAVANTVARRMVVPAHRNGGQAQFIVRPLPLRSDGRLAPLLDLIRADIGAEWSVKYMADMAAMSMRTFLRRFAEMTGMSPGEWLIAERVELAKSLLAEGNDTIDHIAYRIGLGSADTLRHHFAKRVGISPREYRNRFKCVA